MPMLRLVWHDPSEGPLISETTTISSKSKYVSVKVDVLPGDMSRNRRQHNTVS
jgi:hypothetical protein